MNEVRTLPIEEFRAEGNDDNEMILEGYAAVFDKPTVLWTDGNGNEWREVIDRKAFDKTDMRKCCLKYNHESSLPVLARVRGGSLMLNVDDYGLHFRAKVFNTQTGRDIYELVKADGIDECSFAFNLPADGSGVDFTEHRTRRITNIENLWDVSVVDHPAYTEGTSVSARSIFEAEAEKERLESLERDRAKLALKLKLQEV